MTKPTPAQLHVDKLLTDLSVAFLQGAQNFVADKVFPLVPVDKQSDLYRTYSREDWFRDDAKERAPGTESAGGGFNVDNTAQYFAKVRAYHKDVTDQEVANDDIGDPYRDATEFVTQKLAIRREVEWASKYFGTGIWTTEKTGVAAAPGAGQFLHWSNANSDPISDIDNGKTTVAELTGFEPNVLVVNPHVHKALKNHPLVLERVKFFGTPDQKPTLVTAATLAALFEVDRYLVARAVKNTAAEGQAGAYSFVMPKGALLAFAQPTPGLMKPSAGYIFTWRGLLGAGAYGNTVSRFRMDELKSDRIEGEMAFDAKKVAGDMAVFFATAVA